MYENDRVFRGYLRGLLRHLKAIRTTLQNKDYAAAEQLIDKLIKDTQQGLAD